MALTKGKIDIAIASKLTWLVKSLMKEFQCNESIAYQKLIQTELYEILKDAESGMFLEPAEFVEKALYIELKQGNEKMREYITLS